MKRKMCKWEMNTTLTWERITGIQPVKTPLLSLNAFRQVY